MALDGWQDEWQRSEKGRESFRYFPDVGARIRGGWWLNYYVIQVVNGHGDFREKLMSFRLSDIGTCECGEIDNAWHLVSECIWKSRRNSARGNTYFSVTRCDRFVP